MRRRGIYPAFIREPVASWLEVTGMSRQLVSPSQCARLLVLVVLLAAAVPAGPAASGPPVCQPAGGLIQVPGLEEGSGAAASRRSPSRLWTHNDSGPPVLVALDANGAVQRRVRVTGAHVEDWEAIATGPCPEGACIFIGDIGDNSGTRREITIYRVPEPADGDGTVAVAGIVHARYPRGAQNAEALMVTPKGELLIVTKGTTGPVALFRVPAAAAAGKAAVLEPIGRPRDAGRVAAEARVTDGAISPDGAWIALRTNDAVAFHRTADLMAGNWREAGRVSLKGLGEPQGEGITFADDTHLYLIGEGGGRSRPGTFAKLTCAF